METPKKQLAKQIEKGEDLEPGLEDEWLVEDLSDVVEVLLDKVIWFKNIKIQNKEEERQRFKEARKKGEDFIPEFEYREYPYSQEKLLELVGKCMKAAEKINAEHMERYGAKEITPEDLQEFYTEIFREMKLYIKLSADIRDEESWRKNSEKLWPMISHETYRESKEKLEQLDPEEPREEVTPEELAEMFRNEIDRLGADYKVEIRDVSGCKNIPEEKTVVVARGENGERMYSRESAKMLTMHELFHSMRAVNGFRAGEESGFPEILGLHTPFYDRAEEGGAVYREEATGVSYESKEFDYHLRLIAAYKLSQTENFRQEFQEVVEELIELGGSIDRSFFLATRNREALRHHIYQAGRNDWENIQDKEKMLIGKVNQEWAEKLWKEAEAGGMLKKPEIGAEKLFNFRYNS